VRELQNVVERAVITARDGRLNLDRELPDSGGDGVHLARTREATIEAASKRVLQIRDLQQLERKNIMRALEASGWRVAGKDGAARYSA